MTKIILTFVLYLITILTFSQDNTSVKLENTVQKSDLISIKVSVNNITSNNGKVLFAIYNQKGFLVKPIAKLTATITDKKASVVFKDVSKGVYSIISYHDKNENNNMDFSPNGMPLEDYGATNNNLSFGPPQFSTSKFEVKDKDLTFEIKF